MTQANNKTVTVVVRGGSVIDYEVQPGITLVIKDYDTEYVDANTADEKGAYREQIEDGPPEPSPWILEWSKLEDKQTYITFSINTDPVSKNIWLSDSGVYLGHQAKQWLREGCYVAMVKPDTVELMAAIRAKWAEDKAKREATKTEIIPTPQPRE